jgi:hypothetical protein
MKPARACKRVRFRDKRISRFGAINAIKKLRARNVLDPAIFALLRCASAQTGAGAGLASAPADSAFFKESSLARRFRKEDK